MREEAFLKFARRIAVATIVLCAGCASSSSPYKAGTTSAKTPANKATKPAPNNSAGNSSSAASNSANARRVIVTDYRGSPISEAELAPALYSEGNRPIYTDQRGVAAVPANLLRTQWVLVSKPGFRTEHVRFSSTWPMRVTLKAETLAFPETSEVGMR